MKNTTLIQSLDVLNENLYGCIWVAILKLAATVFSLSLVMVDGQWYLPKQGIQKGKLQP